MAECIEREAINRICFMDYFLVDGEVRTESVALVRDIEKLPAADVAPVAHGRWRESGPLLECQSCGEIYSRLGGNAGKLWHYCPNCGAKMDGGAENG